jgi:hypothetical protein
MERERVIATLKAHEAELRAPGVMGVSLSGSPHGFLSSEPGVARRG